MQRMSKPTKRAGTRDLKSWCREVPVMTIRKYFKYKTVVTGNKTKHASGQNKDKFNRQSLLVRYL